MKTPVKTVFPGDSAVVHTNDGRDLFCEVLSVFNTVAGIKVKVQSGHALLTVNPGQVTQIIKKEKP